MASEFCISLNEEGLAERMLTAFKNALSHCPAVVPTKRPDEPF
jgi:hypothetical protein